MTAVAAVIVGPYACADVTTDESEAHSGAIDVDATTLDAGASDPVAFAASVRIAAAAVATEKCWAGRIARLAVAPNRSSSGGPSRSCDCWRNCRCCCYC